MSHNVCPCTTFYTPEGLGAGFAHAKAETNQKPTEGSDEACMVCYVMLFFIA